MLNNPLIAADFLRIRLFLLIMLCTFATVFFVEQYQKMGQPIVSIAHFHENLTDWHLYKGEADEIVVQDGKVSLFSPDLQTSTAMYLVISRQVVSERLRIKALVQSDNVVVGKKPWNRARLLLVQYVNGVARWDLPHSVVALTGTNDWQEVSSVLRISPDCDEARLVVQLGRCSGHFSLKSLSIYQVSETTLYKWAKWSAHGSWVLFIFFLFVPYIKKIRFVLSRPLLLLTLTAILVGTAMPAAVKQDIIKTIDAEFAGESQITNNHVAATDQGNSQPDWLQSAMKEIKISKVAHFSLFALLVLILCYSNPTRPVLLLMLDVLMLACATELNQFFIENRSPLFADVAINMAGGVVGLVLARVIYSLKL